METLKIVLLVLHIIVCLVLTAVVLMQSGKADGLSGAIAGGAETFFGKNKGRTMDAMLSKLTAVFAVLFLALSISLTVVTNKISEKNAEAELQSATQNMQMTTDEGVEAETDVAPETDVDVAPETEATPAE